MNSNERVNTVFNELCSYIRSDLKCKVVEKDWSRFIFSTESGEGSLLKDSLCGNSCLRYEFEGQSKTVYVLDDFDYRNVDRSYKNYKIIGSNVLLKRIIEDSLL